MTHLIQRHKMTIFIVFNLLMTISLNLAHAVTPTLLSSLNMGSHVFGISFAAMCTTNFIFALVWSNVAHTSKKTRILLISGIGYAFAQLLFAYATHENMIYFARLLSGIFAGGFQVGFLSYIVNEAAKEEQARYITYSSIVVSVGAALGFFVGGMLGDISVRLTFFVQIGLSSLMGVLFFVVLGPQEVIEESFDLKTITRSNPIRIIKDSAPLIKDFAVILLMSVFVSAMAVTLFDQSFGYYVKEAFNFLPSQFGIIKAITGVLALVFNIFLIKRKIQNQRLVLKIVLLLMTVFSILIAFQTDMMIFVIMGLIWFGSDTVLIPVLQNLFVQGRKTPQEGNQLAGVYNAINMLGRIGGALITSVIYTIMPTATFFIAGILFAFSLVMIIFGSLKYKN